MYTLEQAGIQEDAATFNREFKSALESKFGDHLNDALQAALGIVVAVAESQGAIEIPAAAQPAHVDAKALKEAVQFVVRHSSLPIGFDDQERVIWLKFKEGGM